MRFANDGRTLHYETHGNGAPVVLLHGIAVSFERNYAQCGWIERLTGQGLQVIGLDFRGHGRSDQPVDPAAYGTANLSGADHFALAVDPGVQFAVADFLAEGRFE